MENDVFFFNTGACALKDTGGLFRLKVASYFFQDSQSLLVNDMQLFF